MKINEEQSLGADAARTLVDQYRIYLDSASRISDRRGTANTFLMTANTALVTVYGFLAGHDTQLASGGSRAWLAPVAGLTICIAWFALIRSYRTLNAAKFAVIRELEQYMPVQLHDLEWEHLRQGRSLSYLPLSRVEQLVPLVFGAIYASLIVAAVVG